MCNAKKEQYTKEKIVMAAPSITIIKSVLMLYYSATISNNNQLYLAQ